MDERAKRVCIYVGEAIRHRRRLLDMTQQEFSIKAGVSRVSVANWEAGKGLVVERLSDICDALKCRIGDLFEGVPDERRRHDDPAV